MARTTRLTRAVFPSKPARARVADELFSVSLWTLPGTHKPKFSCVVSKKMAQRAVNRNKLRRQCREIVSPLLGESHKSIAIVVYPKRAATTASFNTLRASLRGLLSKLPI